MIYAFLVEARDNSCSPNDCSYSILTRVISLHTNVAEFYSTCMFGCAARLEGEEVVNVPDHTW